MNRGLILDPIVPKDFVLGGSRSLGGDVLRPDGQWDAYLPSDEVQNLAMEPMACVTFGTLNCVEILERFEYGKIENYSDRFLAYASGTTINGNSPQKVAETLRKKGVVRETDWPYTPDINSWEQFYAVPAQRLYNIAQEFFLEFSFGHEYVGTDQNSMMEALKYSPLGVAVDAWATPDADGLYRRRGPSNHFCVIYGYKANNYWLVLDTYDNTRKKLAWDFGFEQVKRYTLHRQVTNETAWSRFLSLLRSIFSI